jgi:(p)ppGpp synthase/HD superfamily hydrolase
MNKINWIIEQHEKTNHKYGNYLPYRFHLEMVSIVFEEFKHLLDDNVDYFTGEVERDDNETLRYSCLIACWGHDLIEDARVSYNDVKSYLGQAAAEIIYAVTNEKGKNRKERANNKYYEGIRNTKGAVFVKMCARIANVRFSKLMKSHQYKMYKEENNEFVISLGYPDSIENLQPMFNCLFNLFGEI